MRPSWFDRAVLQVAPRWGLQRLRAQMAADLMVRYYDAASAGRRTEGWRRVSGDGNAATSRGRPTRETARDLLRNNAFARSAVTTIVDHVVGWGIMPKLPAGSFGTAWPAWAETLVCDSDHRRTLSGLARQVMETVAVAGECLVRRRIRRPEDGLPIPLQLQVLEPDFLDETKEANLPNGGWIIQGVEFSAIGERVAYWLFREHPGATRVGVRGGAAFGMSVRIPAEEILHICLPDRPGQVRGVSWLTPIMLRLKDLDDFLDASLYKQKIAACLALILTDPDGTGTPLGVGDDATNPGKDTLQPGLIASFSAGKTATVVQPPSVNEHAPYTETVLREIATGLGISYEDLTGDFSKTSFSSARMARLRHWDRVHAWRWDMLMPQFYEPVWAWAVQVGAAVGLTLPARFQPQWTAPPMPMLEPDKEGLAYARNIRAGITTLSDVLREQGYDPRQVFAEMAADWQELDRLGLILDSDPRNTTQAGQLQGKAAAAAVPSPAPPPAAAAPSPDAEQNALLVKALVARSLENGNGHRDERPMLAEGAIQVPVTVHPPPPAEVTVDARHTTEAGAFVTHVQAASPPNVTVEGATVTVAPPAVTITPPEIHVDAHVAEGAIRAGDVTVTPPAPQAVTIFRSKPTRRRKVPPDGA